MRLSICGKPLMLGLLASLLVGGASGVAVAQDAVRLTANARAFGADVAVLGAASEQAGFAFQVALKMRRGDELQRRLANGESIDDVELAQRYLPTADSYQAVLDWLRAAGLHVDRTYDNRLTVEATGSVAGIRSAMQVALKRVSVQGREYLASDSTPVVPARIAGAILGVNGLQPYLHLNKGIHFTGRSAAPASDASVTPFAQISGNYYPGGILRAYQVLPYLSQTGAGSTTAILIDTFPNLSDVTNFWTETGIPQKTSNLTFIQAVKGSLPKPSGEETLDTEWASSIGYGSKVRVYATTSLSFTDLDSGYQAILSDLGKGIKIQQLSISLGGCEPLAPLLEVETENNLIGLITAKKVSVLIASGDDGAFECDKDGVTKIPEPSYASTEPLATAVGGTHLVINTSANGQSAKIVSESGWSGSGGGLSNVFNTPSYQSKLKPPTRAVPDVAAVGDPATGVEIYIGGQNKEVGGTSASTPIWAGLMSLVNQARTAAGKPTLGELNPRLYPLNGTANFHDDIGGNNGAYNCIKGYDLVTGMGSPVMNKLLPTLVGQN